MKLILLASIFKTKMRKWIKRQGQIKMELQQSQPNEMRKDWTK